MSINAAPLYGIIGRSSAMQRLFQLIGKLAEDDQTTILIQGESGTGKELVAKAIHNHSARASHHFVPLNCAAIPDDLLESELFGHTKGAFTGAVSAKIGRIEYANGGSLFLDEIGDMKPNLQAKLLRVLQEREFEPIGALKAVPVDVRVIAATHRNLEQMVSEGIFREDLYYRLNVVPLVIPPLRERMDDLPLLINHFIKTIGKTKKKPLLGFDPGAMQALLQAVWRGNVRELENLVHHMTILCGGGVVRYQDLPEKYQLDSPPPAAQEAVALQPEIETAPTDDSLASQPVTMDPGTGQDTENAGSSGITAIAENADKHENISCVELDESTNAAFNAELAGMPPLALEETWPEDGIDFNAMVNDFETRLIVQALKVTQGNKKEAARLLNLKRTTLLEKIKKKDLAQDWFNED